LKGCHPLELRDDLLPEEKSAAGATYKAWRLRHVTVKGDLFPFPAPPLYGPSILSAAFMAEEKLMSPEQPSPRTVSPIK
jgi:hypothetical protein